MLTANANSGCKKERLVVLGERREVLDKNDREEEY